MNGRYRITTRPLSREGMGVIYLAEDQGAFGRLRVVKEMLDYVDPDPDSLAYQQAVQKAQLRLEDEARTLSFLMHKGIPDINHYFSENKRNYIVMEYVEGRDLEKQPSRYDDQGNQIKGKPYPPDKVVAYSIQICQVLNYLARQQPPVIHHDIKPANIILDNHGDVKLVHFGTARARMTKQPGGRLGLHKSSIYGTAGYAPKDQYVSQSEPRSDVYALAATMYHLLTDDDPRSHPFSFPHLNQLPPELSFILKVALEPDVPKGFTAGRFQAELETLPNKAQSTKQTFTFQNGVTISDIAGLVKACQDDCEAGKHRQYNRHFSDWFVKRQKHHYAQNTWAILRACSDRDVGLERFLRELDPQRKLPYFRLAPDFNLNPGEKFSGQIHIQHQGHGCLILKLQKPNCGWPTTDYASCKLLPGEVTAVDLTVHADLLGLNRPTICGLTVQADTGQPKGVIVQAVIPTYHWRWHRLAPLLDWGMLGAVGGMIGMALLAWLVFWLANQSPWETAAILAIASGLVAGILLRNDSRRSNSATGCGCLGRALLGGLLGLGLANLLTNLTAWIGPISGSRRQPGTSCTQSGLSPCRQPVGRQHRERDRLLGCRRSQFASAHDIGGHWTRDRRQ
jgi:serine/threonine protein kinase